jgi:phosphatidylserine decarboxylase
MQTIEPGSSTAVGDQEAFSHARPSGALDQFKAWPLYLLPHHAVSRLLFGLTRLRTSLKNPFVRWFIDRYGVDMEEAAEPDPSAYPDFNSFFTRALKPGVRSLIEAADEIACPVDGKISQLGGISGGRIFQAKGQHYSLLELVGGDPALAGPFREGRFATLYLSPRDYHRVHMPLAGELRETVYIPGRLFSVAPPMVRVVPRLFARNERVLAYFDTLAGPMALVLVGAINVAAIETVWSGLMTPPRGSRIQRWTHFEQAVQLARGAEMGRFNMGSSVILLLSSNIEWSQQLLPGQDVQLGQSLGRISSPS